MYMEMSGGHEVAGDSQVGLGETCRATDDDAAWRPPWSWMARCLPSVSMPMGD